MRRKLRIMEHDKKAYSEESEQMLKRQGNLIEKLKDDNKLLCKEMVQYNREQKINKQKTASAPSGSNDSEIQMIKDKIDKELEI